MMRKAGFVIAGLMVASLIATAAGDNGRKLLDENLRRVMQEVQAEGASAVNQGAAEGSKRKLLQDEFEFDSVISFVQELIGEVTQETSLGYTKEICFTGELTLTKVFTDLIPKMFPFTFKLK